MVGYSSLIYPRRLQEDRSLIACPVAEVLSSVSGPVTGPIVPSGMEVQPSFVLVPQQETQTFYHVGVPACGDMHRFTFTIYEAARLFEQRGGRMWINWCFSTPILSQNMRLSGHIL